MKRRHTSVTIALILLAGGASTRAASERPCPDGSLTGLAQCLPNQIDAAEGQLHLLYEEKLALLHGDSRDHFVDAERTWDAYIRPQCALEADQMGLQPGWRSIAEMQCLLSRINARLLKLAKLHGED